MDRNVVVISVTSLRLSDRYDLTYIDDNLNKLSRDLSNILYGTPVVLSYSELYSLVDGLCELRQDEPVRQTLEHLLEHYVCVQVLGLDTVAGEDFLARLRQLWLAFQAKVALIRNIYLTLEIALTKSQRRKYGVAQMALDAFYRHVLQDARVGAKLAHVFVMIDQHRDGARIDAGLLKDVVRMLAHMQMYDGYVETHYLRHAGAYYRRERDACIQGAIVAYFVRVQQRLRDEAQLVHAYLEPASAGKAQAVIKQTFVEDALPTLLARLQERDLFSDGSLADIAVVYDQLGYLPRANDDLCRFFSKFMLAKGRALVCDARNEHTLIASLLQFKDRVDDIVATCFLGAHAYADAVRVAFMKFINQRKYKPAQLLAKYIDCRMRDKLISEELFDKIIVLFRYVQAKDIFEAYYKRYLGKRLLLGKSSSQDAEKSMLGKLKFECGDDFTSKLEGMFKDIDLSDGLIQAFKQRGGGGGGGGGTRPAAAIEFSAQVLTCGSWPTFSKFKMTLPAAMLHYHDVYQEFYRAKYSGRSLEWTGSLDTCLLRARFTRGAKEVQASLFQAGVLLLFNDARRIGYRVMAALLGLDDGELRRTLSSLLSSRARILRRVRAERAAAEEGETPNQSADEMEVAGAVDGEGECAPTGKPAPPSRHAASEIGDDDEFEVNDEFQHKLYRIKVNQVQYKDTEEEQKITEDEVLHDRQLQIDAAVVRLMKQHRGLKHNELLTKLFGMLKFPVNPNDIKKRIESLIERDFIARNPNDPNAYLYVA